MRILDLALRVAGGVLSVVLAVLTALWETVAAGYHLGGMRAPWSIIGAVAGNLFLLWFAYVTVGRRWAMLLPASAWSLTMLLTAYGTAEGDILLPNQWVGLATLFAGLFAFAAPMFATMNAPPGRSRGRSRGGPAVSESDR